MQNGSLETGVWATLSHVLRDCARGAEIGVARGAVGIGKSFALEGIARELEAEGVGVVMITATDAISGNINAFLRAVLGQYAETGSGADAEAAVWAMPAGRPFAMNGRRMLFVVDEAQKLSGRVLETIRGLWDRGDAARKGDTGAPAFGCVLVGNPLFMGKGSTQRVATFEPLIDRLAHNIHLPGPNRAECRAFAAFIAAAVNCADPAFAEELSEVGIARGNLRGMETAVRAATRHADGAPVTVAHLRFTLKTMGRK
jgi:type II secretory pathway predicted ATPase ExeA